ncbi:hypothetical protein LQ948_12115 [Jiella sp. MQZ9-1]|uniref:Uncharacterized protein n=1 Tax=Jiella flava TaxID=2816857 RepID=A0A939JXH9_9HYPH|nr:hypothetical protein [Jiella flava]MBO0663381.1 hypothetical protein [Jiella flava]MCD2471957.1 hypothetical protein [Jiella flava]
MDRAWIDGQPATSDEALDAAAKLLADAVQPFVGGLRTDVAGLRAAFALAKDLGAIVDHADSATIEPFLSALRDGGAFLAAPAEMRRRADRVLVLGDEPATIGADLLTSLSTSEPDLGVRTRGSGRQIMVLGTVAGPVEGHDGVTRIDCASDDLVDVVGMVRARLAGRPIGEGPLGGTTIATIAEFVAAAGFGCIVFSPAEVGALGSEQVFGLAADLNAETRCSTLPLLGSDNAMGAALLSTWTAGFPLRLSFGRREAEHDAALYASDRQLSGAGEADCAVIVDALADGAAAAAPAVALPAIVLAADPAAAKAAQIGFAVASAGRDHDSILYDSRFGSFVGQTAQESSELPTAAAILTALAERLGGRVADAA